MTYQAVHAVPDRFVVEPGHETAAIERVVERQAEYFVVEKRPDAEDAAESA